MNHQLLMQSPKEEKKEKYHLISSLDLSMSVRIFEWMNRHILHTFSGSIVIIFSISYICVWGLY